MAEKIKEISRSIRNILALATKPTKDEFRLFIKITLVGLFGVGMYAFLINIIALGLQSIPAIFLPQIALLVITVIIGIALVIYYYGSRKGKW